MEYPAAVQAPLGLHRLRLAYKGAHDGNQDQQLDGTHGVNLEYGRTPAAPDRLPTNPDLHR